MEAAEIVEIITQSVQRYSGFDTEETARTLYRIGWCSQVARRVHQLGLPRMNLAQCNIAAEQAYDESKWVPGKDSIEKGIADGNEVDIHLG